MRLVGAPFFDKYGELTAIIRQKAGSLARDMAACYYSPKLKSKSTLMIFDRHANLKYKYGSRSFWARGYFVDTVGKNERMISEYIRNQLAEDYEKDQMSLKEFTDPFTGERVK